MSWRVFAVVAGCVATALIAAAAAGRGSAAGTQAAGLVGYVLLWAAVETGLAVRLHARVPRVRAAVILEAHQTASSLAFAFILGHICGLLVDAGNGVGAVEVFVPFAPVNHMVARTAGSLGFWATLATVGSSALIGRIPYRLWRRMHVLTFPAFGLSLIHSVFAGSRFEPGPWLAFYLGTGALIVATCAARAMANPRVRRRALCRPAPLPQAAIVPSLTLRFRGQKSSRAWDSLWFDPEERATLTGTSRPNSDARAGERRTGAARYERPWRGDAGRA